MESVFLWWFERIVTHITALDPLYHKEPWEYLPTVLDSSYKYEIGSLK